MTREYIPMEEREVTIEYESISYKELARQMYNLIRCREKEIKTEEEAKEYAAKWRS